MPTHITQSDSINDLTDVTISSAVTNQRLVYNGSAWVNATTTSPIISSGAVAPASTPGKVGDVYVDTVAKKLYFAAGTASSADWIIAN